MKAEDAGSALIDRTASRVGAQARSHRWLADLERAWQDTFGHGARAPAAPNRPQQRQVFDEHPPPERFADAATALPSQQSGVRDDAPARDGRPVRYEVAVGTPVPVLADPGSDGTRRSAASPCAAVSLATSISRPGPVQQPANRMLPPAGMSPPQPQAPEAPTAVQRAGISARHHAATFAQAWSREAPGMDRQAGPSAPPPVPDRFARRLMQVSGEDQLRANLRDASLSGEQQLSVARELFRQLQAAGTPLRRLYLNGRRFDAGQALLSHLQPIDPE